MTKLLLRPLPLFPLRPLLTHIVTYVSEKHPRLFQRLGEHAEKTFLIEPTDMPFFLVLKPFPDYPELEAVRSFEDLEYDAKISGSLFKLFDLIEGRLDGDAIFFSRDLTIEGDTEAVVALRNAIDDTEGNLIDEIVDSFGLFSLPARHTVSIYRRVRK
jgi:predicted lipid carrier protein YhbT